MLADQDFQCEALEAERIKLGDNVKVLMDAVIKAKPAAAKGQYIKSCTVASTMGPGIKVNQAKLG